MYCETLPVMKISSLWNAKIANFAKFISLLKCPGLQYNYIQNTPLSCIFFEWLFFSFISHTSLRARQNAVFTLFFLWQKTHGLCFCLSHSTRLHDVLPLLTHTEFPDTGAYLDHSQGTDGIHVSERLHLPQSRFIATWTFPSKSNSQRRQVLGEVPQVHLVFPIFHTLWWVCERGIVTQWRARNTIPTWKDEISREGKTIYHYWSWSGTSPHINTHTHMYIQPNIHKYTKTNTHKQIQTHTPIQININTNKTCTHIYTHGVSAVKPSIESALQSFFCCCCCWYLQLWVHAHKYMAKHTRL